MNFEDLISFYGLLPHPEGGFYKRTYAADQVISKDCLGDEFVGERLISTAIYYLLTPGTFSAFHRIKSDELWHFYKGTSLYIHVIHPTGNYEILKLGDNLLNGESFQHLVKAGSWFASVPSKPHGYTFVGCTVSPGFDFNDFELADREMLSSAFPQHELIIKKFTR
jgi:predicted cupin superfamily sugar epimerase